MTLSFFFLLGKHEIFCYCHTRMTVHCIEKFLKLCACAVLGGVLVSCASPTPADRIAENPAVFRTLPPNQQILVQQGRIEQGMTPDAVLLAWGAPNSAPIIGQKDGKRTERWVYQGYEPVPVMSDWAPVYGRYGFYEPYYPASSTAFIPTQDAYVEFVNGKVVSWAKKDNQ